MKRDTFPVQPGSAERPFGHCAWCGKQIGAGWFCTGTHYNLYVARFAAQPGDRPVSGAQEPREADLIGRAREHVTSPGAHALLDEVERGRRRREERPAQPLHAHEVTPADAAMIRMMAGANFGPDATVVLPSGKTITGAEMQRWVEAQREEQQS